MSGPEARCLGLIGGLGPEATSHYYRALLAAHKAAGRTPRLLIAHADVDRARGLVEANDLDGLARYLAGFVAQMAAGGAEMTAMVAITPHICVPQFVPLSPLPLIDMVEEVARAVRQKGLTRVALLGTRFTIESRMFGRLAGVEIVMPKPDEIDFIHDAYLDIVYERHTPEQVERLRALAHAFVARDGAETVLLAGTDLLTVFDPATLDFPAIDCAAVHIEAIMRRLL
jgi:aspartate racemase